MTTLASDITEHRYKRNRFPAEIIGHAVWLYHRSALSLRDVEDLLAERGIDVSFQTVSESIGYSLSLYNRGRLLKFHNKCYVIFCCGQGRFYLHVRLAASHDLQAH